MISAGHDTDYGQDEAFSGQELAHALSAFVDGQANLDGVELASDEVRERWMLYHLIGDALREPTAVRPVTAEFSARMTAALAREAVHGQPATRTDTVRNVTATKAPASSWRRAVLAWPGVAVAAAVASVVWVAQPLFGLEQQSQQAMSVAQTESGGSAARMVEQARPESDYVSAHRQMAGPIAVRQVAFTPGAD